MFNFPLSFHLAPPVRQPIIIHGAVVKNVYLEEAVVEWTPTSVEIEQSVG